MTKSEEQVKNLIKFYDSLIKQEREGKAAHAPKIATNKASRQICETAGIRINCYSDFVNHLKGVLTIFKTETKN